MGVVRIGCLELSSAFDAQRGWAGTLYQNSDQEV